MKLTTMRILKYIACFNELASKRSPRTLKKKKKNKRRGYAAWGIKPNFSIYRGTSIILVWLSWS